MELLTDLAVSNGAILTSNPETAEIIVTRIGMLRRLERHIFLKTAVRHYPQLLSSPVSDLHASRNQK